MLATYKFDRLEQFMEMLKQDIYPEPDTSAQIEFTRDGVESVKDKIRTGDKVLDVGCGRGHALDMFKELGAEVTGITLGQDDYDFCLSKGHDVRMMDMSCLEFEDEHFDGIWARHSLEHSIYPFYTLHEWNRVLKPLGWIYIEVPAPDTSSNHEANPNHYSVLGVSMIHNLMARAGFSNVVGCSLGFNTVAGEDMYLRMIGAKI